MLRISICQTNIAFEDKPSNCETAELYIKKAAEQYSDISLFPEMSLTGFSMNTAATSEKNNFTLQFFHDMSTKYNICTGFGWVKFVPEALCENHYTILNKDGSILSDYIKIHPFSYAGENKFFRAGNHISTFKLNDFCLSTFICYDLRFPEIFQAASTDSSVIIVAANWPFKRQEHWETLLKARAIENLTYIVGINCVGTQDGQNYKGGSCIYGPNGDKLLECGENAGVFTYTLKNCVDSYRVSFPVKADRKNDFYKSIF
jgi:omega-amidase